MNALFMFGLSINVSSQVHSFAAKEHGQIKMPKQATTKTHTMPAFRRA